MDPHLTGKTGARLYDLGSAFDLAAQDISVDEDEVGNTRLD